MLTAAQLANVIHEAAFRNRFDLEATRQAAMNAPRGATTSTSLDASLNAHLSGSAGTRSALEDHFLAQLKHNGVPEPLVNTKVQDIEVDFHWPDENLCVEIDGPGHQRPRTQAEDRGRDAKLRAAGHDVVRLRPDAARVPCRTMPADPDCLFCKIVAGEIPSTRVDEDERTIAFMDINPATRGHLLVIPREHSATCSRSRSMISWRARGWRRSSPARSRTGSEPTA